MIWAALLIAGLGRDVAIREFRESLRFIFHHPQKESLSDVTLSGFAQLPTTLKDQAMAFLCRNEAARRALAPLLLFDGLPARDVWVSKLKGHPPNGVPLFEAVRLTLFHQSQEATDCRWVRLMGAIVCGRMIMPHEQLLLLNGYPTKGDQTIVRPSIRSAESVMDMGESTDRAWPRAFWDECWRKTPCMARTLMLKDSKSEQPSDRDILGLLIALRERLATHWEATHTTTAIDPRHDAVFGIAFYAIRIVHEILLYGGTRTVLARYGLRTLLELRISLAYLLKQDSDELWRQWRAYGTGQA